MPSIRVTTSDTSSIAGSAGNRIGHFELKGPNSKARNFLPQTVHKKPRIYQYVSQSVWRELDEIFAERDLVLDQMSTDESEHLADRLALLDVEIDELRWKNYLESPANVVDREIKQATESLTNQLSILIAMIAQHLGSFDGQKG